MASATTETSAITTPAPGVEDEDGGEGSSAMFATTSWAGPRRGATSTVILPPSLSRPTSLQTLTLPSTSVATSTVSAPFTFTENGPTEASATVTVPSASRDHPGISASLLPSGSRTFILPPSGERMRRPASSAGIKASMVSSAKAVATTGSPSHHRSEPVFIQWPETCCLSRRPAARSLAQ